VIRPVYSKPRHNSGRNVAAAVDCPIFGDAPVIRRRESPANSLLRRASANQKAASRRLATGSMSALLKLVGER